MSDKIASTVVTIAAIRLPRCGGWGNRIAPDSDATRASTLANGARAATGALIVACDPIRAFVCDRSGFRFGELVEGPRPTTGPPCGSIRCRSMRSAITLTSASISSFASLKRSVDSFFRRRITIASTSGGTSASGARSPKGGNARGHVHSEESHLAVVIERPRPGEHLVEHHPERVEVRPRVDRLPERLLRRHVLRRAVDHPELGENLGRAARRRRGRLFVRERADRHLRDPEVEHLHEVGVAVLRDEHYVLWFEVAVNDPEPVRARDGARDLVGDVESAPQLERPFSDDLAERVPFDEFEDEKEGAVLEHAEVGRRRDVRVIDVRGRERLALEPRHDLRQAAHLGVKDLHREALAHVGVLRLVDGTHSPFPEEAVDAVTPRKHGADERLRASRPRGCHLLLPGSRSFCLPPSETVSLGDVWGSSFINGPAPTR